MSINGIFSEIKGSIVKNYTTYILIILLFLVFFIIERHEERKSLREHKHLTQELKDIILKQDMEFTKVYRNDRNDYMDIIPDTMMFWGHVIEFNHPWARMMFNQILRDILSNPAVAIDVLRRLAYFKPDLLKTFDRYNIHNDVLYLAGAESGAYHLAVSGAKPYLKNGGAVGTWQWMYNTALEYGVIMTRDIDMRRNTWYMSDPVCNHLIELRSKTGSIAAALRSYNSGKEAYMRVAKRQSWVKDPWFIDVNFENNLYLYYILAWKFVYENAYECGLEFREDDFFCSPTVIIKVRLARGARLRFLDLGRLIKRDPFELEILNSGHISRINGFRGMVADRKKRVSIYSLRLPADVDPNILEAANASKDKKEAIKGVTFLAYDLINKKD